VIEDAGTYRAPLTKKASEELGLSEDVTAVLGALDQKCAGTGAGIDEKTAVISMGTCSAILIECGLAERFLASEYQIYYFITSLMVFLRN